MSATNRREFLKALSSVAAFATIAPLHRAHGAGNSWRMGYRRLGKTNLQVSEIGLGGHHYTLRRRMEEGELGLDYQAERTRQIAAALEVGVNFFDTTYDHEAESLGLALTELKAREKCFVTCDYCMDGTKPSELRWSATRRFERSLRLLKSDYVDVYRPTSRDRMSRADIETLFDLFTKWKQQGKAHFFGISGHEEGYLIWAVQNFPLDLILVPYSVGLEKAAERLFPLAKQRDVGVVVIKPFAGGSLFRAAETTRRLRKAEGESIARAALKFILENPHVSTVVPGANTVGEVLDNAQASGTRLGKSERASLRVLAQVIPSRLDSCYVWLRDWCSTA